MSLTVNQARFQQPSSQTVGSVQEKLEQEARPSVDIRETHIFKLTMQSL
jgi:hypothetical protein